MPEQYQHPITVTVNVEEPQECEEEITVQVPVEVQVPTTVQKKVSRVEPCQTTNSEIVNSIPVSTVATVSTPTVVQLSTQTYSGAADIPTIIVKAPSADSTAANTIQKTAHWKGDAQKPSNVISMDELKKLQAKPGVTVQWDDLPNAST